MDILKDLYYTNKAVGKKTISSLIKNWPIIFLGLFYSIANIIILYMLPYFGILAGIIGIIVNSGLISSYLYVLNCITERDKFSFNDFKYGFQAYLRKVWGILFLAWVANIGMSMFIIPIFSRGISPVAIILIYYFVLLTLLNSLPEVIYQKHYSSWESILYSIDFVKDNWIEWFIPNFILIGIIILLLRDIFITLAFGMLPLLTLRNPIILVLYILGQIWLSFIMIYRGYLFETLSTSNRRKRLFMRKF